MIGPAAPVDDPNRPGAGGRLAVEDFTLSAVDGSTLLVTPTAMVASFPHLYSRLPLGPSPTPIDASSRRRAALRWVWPPGGIEPDDEVRQVLGQQMEVPLAVAQGAQLELAVRCPSAGLRTCRCRSSTCRAHLSTPAGNLPATQED